MVYFHRMLFLQYLLRWVGCQVSLARLRQMDVPQLGLRPVQPEQEYEDTDGDTDVDLSDLEV